MAPLGGDRYARLSYRPTHYVSCAWTTMKRSRLQKSLTMWFPIAGTKRCSGAARFNLFAIATTMAPSNEMSARKSAE